MNCQKCRWRKNAIRCGTCTHLEERIEKENYIPRVALWPRKDNYEEMRNDATSKF